MNPIRTKKEYGQGMGTHWALEIHGRKGIGVQRERNV